jgi:hypothetical protein
MKLFACILLTSALLHAHDPISTRLTWAQEISRILYKRCLSCHKTGPVSFVSYESARPWAKAIKEEVLNRTMPPWGAVKGFGDFRDDRSLTQDEITRIAEWVEGGAPEGDPRYLPRSPELQPKPAIPKAKRARSLRTPATLLGIHPLASAESIQITARLADGSVIPLLWLQGYKNEWNQTFLYRVPIVLPAGAQISMTSAFPVEYLVPPSISS